MGGGWLPKAKLKAPPRVYLTSTQRLTRVARALTHIAGTWWNDETNFAPFRWTTTLLSFPST